MTITRPKPQTRKMYLQHQHSVILSYLYLCYICTTQLNLSLYFKSYFLASIKDTVYCVTTSGAVKFCGSKSALEKEAGSELGSIWHFEEPKAEAFFIKHRSEMRKRLKFCGSESGITLKKEAGSGSKKYSILLPHPWLLLRAVSRPS